MKHSPSSKYMTVAMYNGGWEDGEDLGTFTDVELFTTMTRPVGGKRGRWIVNHAESRDANADAGTPYVIGTYEAGPGYSLPPEGTEQQNLMMKSQAGGMATIDAFLRKAAEVAAGREDWEQAASYYERMEQVSRPGSEDALAADIGDQLAQPAQLGLGGLDHLEAPPAPLGVALVHPHQVAREERRLLAAGAGPDLDDRGPRVGGVARQQRQLERLLGLGQAGAQGGGLLAHALDLGHLAWAFGLNVAWLGGGMMIYAWLLRASRERGALTQIGE